MPVHGVAARTVNRMVVRIVNILDKAVDLFVVTVCVLLLFIGAYSVADEIWLYGNASDRTLVRFRPEEGKTLAEDKPVLKDQAAWITIDDTAVDYPVMQGKDNYEYLNRDPYGEFSLSGSVFLDAGNSSDFSDGYSLIYGHHMDHGAMFGALDAFREEGYFSTHRHGTLAARSGVYDLEIFSVCLADAADQTVFCPQERSTEEIQVFLKENAMLYTDPEKGERILVLSTCTGDDDRTRLLVAGTIHKR